MVKSEGRSYKFLENPEWYTEDEFGYYELTDKAPEEAVRDYELYMKDLLSSLGFEIGGDYGDTDE